MRPEINLSDNPTAVEIEKQRHSLQSQLCEQTHFRQQKRLICYF